MADYLDKDGLQYFWDKVDAKKQDALVSGENIKTINNNSLLGSGNIDIQGGGGDVTDVEVNGVSVVDQDGVAEVVVPTKTSDLTNDSDFVSDANYVHTDNNFTNADATKLSGIESGAEVNVQANWTEADSSADSYIQNKPTIPTVNDATLTIQKNGTDVQTFTANSSTDKTANITVPTATSDLTNDSNFVSDASYVHTDNNFTTTLKDKLDGIEAGAEVNDVNDVEVDGTSVVSGGVASIDLTGKQDTLVSGTNIKTVNNNSLLGSGNVAVQETLVSGTNIKTINGNTLLGNGDMILSASDVTAVYQKHESYYVTTQSSESTIPINVSGYRSTDILLVDINGLDLVLGTDYTISGTNIVLATPITHAGAVVHFIALRAGAVPTQDLSALKGDKGDKGDAGGVTGVKGNNESTYRTGDVNLTPANIGAVPTSRTVNGHALSSDISLTASDVGAVASSEESWHNLSLASGLTSRGQNCYRKINGFVEVYIAFSVSGTHTSLTNALTTALPDGYRPKGTIQMCNGANTTTAVVAQLINSGMIQYYTAGNTGAWIQGYAFFTPA